jgi:serine/threonine-protein kinase
VFRAFDPEHDRLVAVKRFQLDVPPERMHQLVGDLERLIAAELSHPAIAAPIAAGMSGTAAYLAMEYVSGDSLDLALREYGAAPPADALRVAAQLASALDFAAVVGVFHGALHPRDVLLSSEDTRITGLGVASALERIGIPAPLRRPYTAPERIGGGAWDRRADVFSLAALIFEMLYGRRVAGTGEAIGDSIVELPGADLIALRQVFARGLAGDADARFGTALELVEALQAAFTRSATGVASVPPVRTNPERSSGRPSADTPRLPLDDEAVTLEADRAAPLPAEPEAALPLTTPSFDEIAVDDAKHEPPGPPVQTADLALHADDDARFRDIEPGAPPRSEPASEPAIERPVEPPAPTTDRHSVVPQAELLPNAIEPSRSAVWPLALALGIGVAIGFAGGYGVGLRDRAAAPAGPTQAVATATSPAASPPVAATPAPPAPAPHESSEMAMGSGAKPPQPSEPAPGAERKPAPPSAGGRPAELNGRLLVRSTPSGARVFVDGHEYGTTPVPVRDLSRGLHRVRVVRDGYATVERRVLLTPARPSLTIVVPLARRPPASRSTESRTADALAARPSAPSTVGRFVGALTVESRPSGARVFLDGALVGTTPLQLPEVRAGSHALMLEHDGYNRWSSAIRIVASETNRVTASLER